MTQAQSFDAGNSSDLQNNKPMTAKRMKRMGYLSRTQRATGSNKIVQGAVAEVMSAIYEVDFLRFSYGFSAGAQPASGARVAEKGPDDGAGQLGAGCRHPQLLRLG